MTKLFNPKKLLELNIEAIKVYFSDMEYGFDVADNYFLRVLQQHYDVVVTKDCPDFLFYGPYGVDYLQYADCVKIFISAEAVSPDFNECDYAVNVDPIVYGRRYFRFAPQDVSGLSMDAFETNDMAEDDSYYLTRNFCNFIYSQDSMGEGSLLRKKFCRLLMRYKHIDCPGRILNNMQNAISPRYGEDWCSGKIEFLKKYKFTIAFENFEKCGYVTEKMVHPLFAHSVPIYWGDPEVTKSFNKEAFINVRDFSCLEDVVDYVIYLDTHDDEYMKMLRSYPLVKETFMRSRANSLEDFICSIVAHGKIPFGKRIYAHAVKDKLLSENTRELAKFYLQNHEPDKAKKHAHTCLALNTTDRPYIYPILEEIYRNDREGFHALLEKRRQLFMDSSVVRPEDLVELCEIAKCFVHLQEDSIAADIKKYALEQNPECHAADAVLLHGRCEWLFKNGNYGVWGAGTAGCAIIREIQAFGGNVQVVVDSEASKHGTEIHGVRIASPEVILKYAKKLNYLIICHYTRSAEIIEQAKMMGVPEDMMIAPFAR